MIMIIIKFFIIYVPSQQLQGQYKDEAIYNIWVMTVITNQNYKLELIIIDVKLSFRSEKVMYFHLQGYNEYHNNA
jgi:hypothetical protein